MNGDTTPGSIWIKAYTSDGYQISLTLPALTVSDAMRHLDDVRAAGLLTMMPEATEGEQIETMTMCVRRETVNKNDDTVPVIDCYFSGGKFKWVTIYLDDRDQLEEFELHSGLTVRSMPLYASQAPLLAGERATAKFEIACRPFVAVKVPNGEKVFNGTKQMTYKFARYVTPGAAKAPEAKRALSDDEARKFVAHWKQVENLSYKEVLTALDVEDVRDWRDSLANAHARVALWCKDNPAEPDDDAVNAARKAVTA